MTTKRLAYIRVPKQTGPRTEPQAVIPVEGLKSVRVVVTEYSVTIYPEEEVRRA